MSRLASDPTLRFLREIVAIDSVNPSLVPGGAGEQAVAEAVAKELRELGLDVCFQTVSAGRPNIVGVLGGRAAGRSLIFCGHLDTVGVAGMSAPFDPVERNGRLYGRGAQDMKGGIAAMVGAARVLATSGGLAAGRLIVTGVVDEEYASVGAEALVAEWHADAAVVTEPTDLAIGIGHKGFAWVEVETRGRAAHGSRPRDGRDAIIDMGRVLARLEPLDRSLQSRPAHPLLGTASLHASTIEGGRELSVYPDRCVLRLERRTLADEADGVALTEVQQILGTLHAEDAGFNASATLMFERPPHLLPAEHELPQVLAAAAARRLPPKFAGMSFWTDAAIFARAGIPAVLFGPGGEGLHGPDEYVRLDDVLICCEVLADFARRFCG